jgi:hypothetical protein
MTPLEFLREEFENVKRALGETLRYEYGPERSIEYYNECQSRLSEIDKSITGVPATAAHTIADYLAELSLLATWISLVERSRLGEFSWPFADELRRMATVLLTEKTLKGDPRDPIIHIVAEGGGYRIVYEPSVPAASGRRQFVVVAFPRSLKHHVLLHSIFGHELGHTALHTAQTGNALRVDVMGPLSASGPLANNAAATAWLNATNAPREIKNVLGAYAARHARPYTFLDRDRQMWLIELTCDLFGLLLFGPGFFAAHRTLLQPTHPSAYEIDLSQSTHPPYAVRHKMLVQAMRIVGWNAAITASRHREFHKAEVEMLEYVLDDTYPRWAAIFDDAQLKASVEGIRKIFGAEKLGYSPLRSDALVKLVRLLGKGQPPVIADITGAGRPRLTRIDISQTLYAGWVHWIGRRHLKANSVRTFLLANQLCNHALLQQCAIDRVIAARKP